MAKSSKTKSPESATAGQKNTQGNLPELVALAERLETMAALGATPNEIQLVLGLTAEELATAEADPVTGMAYRRGKTAADQKIVESLYQNALHGNTEAQKFWLSSRQPERWAATGKKPVRRDGPEAIEAPAVPNADPMAPPSYLGSIGRQHWADLMAKYVFEPDELPTVAMLASSFEKAAALEERYQQTTDLDDRERLLKQISRVWNEYRKTRREAGLDRLPPAESPRGPAIPTRGHLRIAGGA
jgi:hypothetical protein